MVASFDLLVRASVHVAPAEDQLVIVGGRPVDVGLEALARFLVAEDEEGRAAGGDLAVGVAVGQVAALDVVVGERRGEAPAHQLGLHAEVPALALDGFGGVAVGVEREVRLDGAAVGAEHRQARHELEDGAGLRGGAALGADDIVIGEAAAAALRLELETGLLYLILPVKRIVARAREDEEPVLEEAGLVDDEVTVVLLPAVADDVEGLAAVVEDLGDA